MLATPSWSRSLVNLSSNLVTEPKKKKRSGHATRSAYRSLKLPRKSIELKAS